MKGLELLPLLVLRERESSDILKKDMKQELRHRMSAAL